MNQAVQKNTLYVGGLAEEVNEAILHAAFIPFGDIKDVKTPLDHATQKHRSFGFVTFLEREDASAAMDNMDGAELYGRVLTVNYALPEKIKGGEQGWAAQPIPHKPNKHHLDLELLEHYKYLPGKGYILYRTDDLDDPSQVVEVWADADTWFERQQQEEEMKRLQEEQKAAMQVAEDLHRKKMAEEREGEKDEDPMAMAEAEVLKQNATS
uniref:Peptidyl-prolyl cis-trans isomerase E n=1 Tax=Solanum tuberosum TaxID=4113 RepID=M0ZP52_SOLTU